MHPPGRHPQVESLDGDLTVSAAAEVGLAQPGVGDREVVRVVIGELKGRCGHRAGHPQVSRQTDPGPVVDRPDGVDL